MSRTKMLLFDVDGTLTEPRKAVTRDVLDLLSSLREHYILAIVGGSDLKKQQEQLGDDVVQRFDYVFSENGLHSFHLGREIHKQNLTAFLGDEKIKTVVNTTLRYVADLDIPVKRGTFFELRNGMINVSPIGRNCTQSEREEFEQYDKKHNVRAAMVEALRQAFGNDYGLHFSVGGQISFDMFPTGWDKTYCLQFVPAEVTEVHFFGDKTAPGGNDHEIYEHPRTIGHAVTTYSDTLGILKDVFAPDCKA